MTIKVLSLTWKSREIWGVLFDERIEKCESQGKYIHSIIILSQGKFMVHENKILMSPL